MLRRVLRWAIKDLSKERCGCGRMQRSAVSSGMEPATQKDSPLKAADEEISTKPIESRSPAKGLFLNKIDHLSLVYPEFVDTDDVHELETSIEKLQNYFEQNVRSAEIDKEGKIPEDVITDLKKMKLFGTLIPREFGGLGLTGKEQVRVVEEMGRDWSVLSTLSVHHLVAYAVNKYGTDEQKMKYLPKLASGEAVGAFCLTEEGSGFDSAAMTTTTVASNLVLDRVELNGRKSWVTNGKEANLLLVFAKSREVVGSSEGDIPLTTAFLVDKTEAKGGVSLVRRRNTIGLKGAEFWDVQFEKVNLTELAVLGSPGLGFEMAQEIMESQRHSFGAAVAGLMKRLLEQVSAHCNAVKRYDMTLSDNPSVRRRVADLALQTYLLETMSYYVGGTMDEDPDRDIEVEGAIVNRSAKKLLCTGLCHAMEIMGAASCQADSELSRLYRDAMTLSSFLSSPDVLTDQIALIGLSTWAEEFGSDLPKIRNPVRYPWYTWKKSFIRRTGFENPKLIHFIQESVHPSLEPACRGLEESMARFESVFATIVEHHGKDVQFQSYILERLCEVVTHLFAMITVIARTSRSYSIGLRNSDSELVWASGYCYRATRQVRQMLEDLVGSTLETEVEDKVLDKVAESIFQLKGYPIESPLKRNW